MWTSKILENLWRRQLRKSFNWNEAFFFFSHLFDFAIKYSIMLISEKDFLCTHVYTFALHLFSTFLSNFNLLLFYVCLSPTLHQAVANIEEKGKYWISLLHVTNYRCFIHYLWQKRHPKWQKEKERERCDPIFFFASLLLTFREKLNILLAKEKREREKSKATKATAAAAVKTILECVIMH